MDKFLTKGGRFAYGAMIAAFLLPFFSVDCEGMTVARVSGFDLVAGGDVDGLIADAAEEGGGGGDLEGFEGDLSVDPEPWAIILLVILVGGFGLAFVTTNNRKLLPAHLVVGLAAGAAEAMLYRKMTSGADLPAEAAGQDVTVSIGMGFGLMIVTLGIAAITVAGAAALKNRGAPPPD